jgi:hypothetical protein
VTKFDLIYDLESYPNFFSASFKCYETKQRARFEISDRVNQSTELIGFLNSVKDHYRMVGFNNVGYDYLLLHLLMQMGWATAIDLYGRSIAIISADKDEKFNFMVWPSDRFAEQLDLYKIHHFDNVARSTSLKMLEFNMRSPNIRDLPFPPGTVLTPDQMDTTLSYNDHDVDETERFYEETLDMIRFREELTAKYRRDFMNHNDTKIGKDFFVMELEQAGVECFENRKPRQTWRSQIHLKDAVFPYVRFDQPEFERVRQWLYNQTITETKGVFKDLSATIDGFTFDFGTGGIHGSVDACTVLSDERYAIIDLDATSYYTSLGIANRMYPEHLSDSFCDIYADLKKRRVGYKKGTPENAMLKLALNGVYGDSNNKYSPFYDPFYTMKITINGQLLLCMLAEQLMKIDDLQMIQINTDGLTVRVRRDFIDQVDIVRNWWEKYTLLELEEARYSRMFIRDVNNYIAEYEESGNLKRKGAYCYGNDLAWHQNQSSQVIAMAAEAALVRGVPIEQFILGHQDIYDFMLRTKVPRSSRLVLTVGDIEFPLQNITRFYVSKSGGSLVKIMPPLAKQLREARVFKKPDGTFAYSYDESSYWNMVTLGYEYVGESKYAPERRIGICAGWQVTECNDIMDATAPINYDYYIQETKKLVEPLQ